MVSEELHKIRHDSRTLLNHVVGYGDMLKEDCATLGHPELSDIYEKIHLAAFAIRDPLSLIYADPQPPEEEKLALQRQIYASLYDVISLIQTAKRNADDSGVQALIADTKTMLDSANGIIEFLETTIAGGPPDAVESPMDGRKGPSYDESTAAKRPARILVVDDDQANRDIISRHLARQGHEVRSAENGEEALAILSTWGADIAILDVMMPRLNGYQTLEAIKADKALSGIFVIVISAIDEPGSMARCIELGAEDYLPREFDPVILKARIDSCMEKKVLRERERENLAEIARFQRRYEAELRDAASYVRSLLPSPIDSGAILSDWAFTPSASLGGDIFGYRFFDPGRLAAYLIDASGHGIGAALFSVSVANLLNSGSLSGADFLDPGSVASRLNVLFGSERHNDLYMTFWYGVFDLATGELAWTNAGGPPALLLSPGGACARLEAGGPAVGVFPEASFPTARTAIPSGSRLFLFSDGSYEARSSEGGVLGLERLVDIVREEPGLSPRRIVAKALAASGSKAFEDDVSLICFGIP